MNRFMCWHLVDALNFLKDMQNAAAGMKLALYATDRLLSNPSGVAALSREPIPDETKKCYLSQLAYIQEQCQKLELDASFVRCQLFNVCLSGAPSFEQVGQQATVLWEAIHGDLQKRRFAFVPPEKARVLDGMGHEWSVIWSHILDSRTDSEEAVYCYALGRNDACIFHSMRVAERGLRVLAKEFHVKMKRPIEYSSWGDLLKAINDKIKATGLKPRGPKRQAALEFYSRAAGRCERMNHLWRREISHARKGVKYLDVDASNALGYTLEFMNLVAERIADKERRKKS
jgi:hypothetical protein